MTLLELKKIIDELPEEDMELDVRVLADHGQTPMRADFAEVGYIDQDTYMPDEVNPEDAGDDCFKVFIIG